MWAQIVCVCEYVNCLCGCDAGLCVCVCERGCARVWVCVCMRELRVRVCKLSGLSVCVGAGIVGGVCGCVYVHCVGAGAPACVCVCVRLYVCMSVCLLA